MTDLLEMLAYSGPLPIEHALWKAGNSPREGLEQIIGMTEKGLLKVTGLPAGALQRLLADIQAPQPAGRDATLMRINVALADTNGTIELTRKGLLAAPQVS